MQLGVLEIPTHWVSRAVCAVNIFKYLKRKLQYLLLTTFQDGSEVAVAVKTCKVDGESSMTDQLLKEAGNFWH